MYKNVCLSVRTDAVLGKILTIETIPLKLPRRLWVGPDQVDADQTYFPDEFLRHVLYITRIYFIYGAPSDELIGKSGQFEIAQQ